MIPHLFPSLIRLIKAELKVAVALFILLGYMIGFSLANPSAVAADIQIQQVADPNTTPTNQLYIDETPYQGLVFGAKITSFYTVKDVTGGSVYVTESGLTALEPDRPYRFVVNLQRPLDNSAWYLDFDSDRPVSINGQVVASAQTPITMPGAWQIVGTFGGNTTIRSLSRVAPDATATESFTNLYIAPSRASVSIGATRTFLAVALDESGNAFSVTNQASWSSSNTAVATIDPNTGHLQSVAAGTTQITARINALSATANITVQPAVDFLTRPTSPTTPTLDTPAPGAPADTPLDSPAPEPAATPIQAITSAVQTIIDQITNALNSIGQFFRNLFS